MCLSLSPPDSFSFIANAQPRKLVDRLGSAASLILSFATCSARYNQFPPPPPQTFSSSVPHRTSSPHATQTNVSGNLRAMICDSGSFASPRPSQP